MSDFQIGLPYLSIRFICTCIPVTISGLGHNMQDQNVMVKVPFIKNIFWSLDISYDTFVWFDCIKILLDDINRHNHHFFRPFNLVWHSMLKYVVGLVYE